MNSEIIMYTVTLLFANFSAITAILSFFYLIDRLSPKKTN